MMIDKRPARDEHYLAVIQDLQGIHQKKLTHECRGFMKIDIEEFVRLKNILKCLHDQDQLVKAEMQEKSK